MYFALKTKGQEVKMIPPTVITSFSVTSCVPLQHAGGDGVGREDLKGPAYKTFGLVKLQKQVLSLCLRQRL